MNYILYYPEEEKQELLFNHKISLSHVCLMSIDKHKLEYVLMCVLMDTLLK